MPESTSPPATLCAAPDPHPTAPGFSVPPGACDCHLHVFGPVSHLVEGRSYTPPDASLDTYQRMMQTLGLSRAVIVQPSVYGTDNRTTMAAVAQGGPEFRAVVVVNDNVDLRVLEKLSAAGARGVRVNALFSRDAHRYDLKQLCRTLADANMHLQILTDVSAAPDLMDLVPDLPIPVVFDHFGHVPAQLGIENPGFQALLRLVSNGQAWVKLSAGYRMTECAAPPYHDTLPFAQNLIQANPEKLLWASDWPHPHIGKPMPNDGELLDALADAASDVNTRNQILVENPARLYGFDQIGPKE